ncbi:MAG TPA: ComEC/Rec2 family competence protein [Candidatus Babeliales bacterium]|nr:ComEC/Rec2 family competence protein [Candidatus Babeliales bacterium]
MHYLYTFSIWYLIALHVIIPIIAIVFWYLDNWHIWTQLLLYTMYATVLGASCYAYQWYRFDQFHQKLSKACSIVGTITAIDPVEHLRTPCRITMHINQAQMIDSDSIIYPHADIYLYSKSTGDLQVSDSISLNNVYIKKPKDADFTHYLVKEGIYATLFVDISKATAIYSPSWSIARWIAQKRSNLFTNIRTKLSKQSFALYSALFLGNRSFDKKETDPLNIYFKRWGIAHIYARSGMHLGLIVLACFFIMRSIPIGYWAKQIMVTLLIIVYTLLSWSSISFLRSLWVFLLYQWCRFIKEPYSVLYLTFLVCNITLLCNPLQLFFLDFQLSYALTAALAFVYHIRAQ